MTAERKRKLSTAVKLGLSASGRNSNPGSKGPVVYLTKTPISTTSVFAEMEEVYSNIVREGLHCMETQVVKYRPQGVCCTRITYEIRDNRLFNVCFQGGCHGNAQGLARLLEGMQASEAKKRLSGITCESKPTSCPDQLACSLQCC